MTARPTLTAEACHDLARRVLRNVAQPCTEGELDGYAEALRSALALACPSGVPALMRALAAVEEYREHYA